MSRKVQEGEKNVKRNEWMMKFTSSALKPVEERGE
jgi:hypothetical protein